MLKILRERYRQGHRTASYPKHPPILPDRLRGMPTLETNKCLPECCICAQCCPTEALFFSEKQGLQIDLGKCLFCTNCEESCPKKAIHFTNEYRLSASRRSSLVVKEEKFLQTTVLEEKLQKLFGRSLQLRQVSAGGCNACEADINVLNTLTFDWGRFGIQIVASPRHADGLIITGPVTKNMQSALVKTYQAIPSPKIVIAVGACAISGGLFYDHPETHQGVEEIIPVDLFIPGCPPHPYTILDGLLRLLGTLK